MVTVDVGTDGRTFRWQTRFGGPDAAAFRAIAGNGHHLGPIDRENLARCSRR